MRGQGRGERAAAWAGQRERGGERVSSREVPLPMQLLQRGAICDLLPESGWEDNLAWWGRRGDGGEWRGRRGGGRGGGSAFVNNEQI